MVAAIDRQAYHGPTFYPGAHTGKGVHEFATGYLFSLEGSKRLMSEKQLYSFLLLLEMSDRFDNTYSQLARHRPVTCELAKDHSSTHLSSQLGSGQLLFNAEQQELGCNI
jgi:hypothetical protein